MPWNGEGAKYGDCVSESLLQLQLPWSFCSGLIFALFPCFFLSAANDNITVQMCRSKVKDGPIWVSE
jgi:hypothetical protein